MTTLPPGQPPAPPRSGGGKWLLLGALGCLGVLLFGGCIIGGIVLYLASVKPAAPEEEITATPPSERSIPAESFNKPAGASETYTNDLSRLTAELRPDFVPFTFQYPATWKVTARGDTPGDSNFVEVQKVDGDKMVENFAVGSFNGSGNLDTDRRVAESLTRQFSAKFQAATDDYHETAAGPVTVTDHRYDAYQFLFTAKAKDAGDPIFGRVILISGGNAGHAKGVVLLLSATDKSGITNPANLGESDELAALLHSFTLTP